MDKKDLGYLEGYTQGKKDTEERIKKDLEKLIKIQTKGGYIILKKDWENFWEGLK